MATRKNVLRIALGLVLVGGTAYMVPAAADAALPAGCTITCAGGSCSGSDGYSCTCSTQGSPECKPANAT